MLVHKMSSFLNKGHKSSNIFPEFLPSFKAEALLKRYPANNVCMAKTSQKLYAPSQSWGAGVGQKKYCDAYILIFTGLID